MKKYTVELKHWTDGSGYDYTTTIDDASGANDTAEDYIRWCIDEYGQLPETMHGTVQIVEYDDETDETKIISEANTWDFE